MVMMMMPATALLILLNLCKRLLRPRKIARLQVLAQRLEGLRERRLARLRATRCRRRR
jgi:hypothetical protein